MDKLIFGMSQVKFCGLEIGWFDEQGVTPAGTAATQVDIYAAQVKDGPVATITSNPGKKAFTGNLIDMSAENLVNTIGGSKDDQGNWEPPEKWEKTGVMDIVCDSGHTIRLYKAKVTGNDFGGGVNSQSWLSVPPAPEFIFSTQSIWSASSRSIFLSSRASTAADAFA